MRGQLGLTNRYTVLTFNACSKCVGSLGVIHNRMPSCHPVSWDGCMDDLTTKRSFNSQATLVIGVLGLYFDMLSIGAGRLLVQELNVYAVVPKTPWPWHKPISASELHPKHPDFFVNIYSVRAFFVRYLKERNRSLIQSSTIIFSARFSQNCQAVFGCCEH